MKAKFIILVTVGLCLAALTQAQIPGKFKDSRDLNRDRQEMAHHHHHRHHHGHSHRAV